MEFALVSLAFVMMLLGVIELGRYYFTAEAVRTITAEAARATLIYYRTHNGACPSQDTIKTTALLKAPYLGSTGLILTVTCATDTNGAKTLQVSASYPFSTSVPWLKQLTAIADDSRVVVDPNS